MILTIFTPAFNRAHTLPRTYKSLCNQTCKDFEWLIVDDGSTDNTSDLVKGWISEGIIPIRYIYQENQGMHGAHNTAYRNIYTELNTCIDSDDYMPNDAVEKIVSFWLENGRESYSGLVGLDITEDGKVIGTPFPDNQKTVRVGEFYEKGGSGDKKLVYRTDIIKSVPEYPVFKGEKYIGLAYKYLLVEQKYEMLVMNEPLVVVEYQEDGSSNNMYRQYWKNPNGWVFYRKFEMKVSRSLKRKCKVCVHYVAACIHAGRYKEIINSPLPLLSLIALPFGIGWYFYVKNKNRC